MATGFGRDKDFESLLGSGTDEGFVNPGFRERTNQFGTRSSPPPPYVWGPTGNGSASYEQGQESTGIIIGVGDAVGYSHAGGSGNGSGVEIVAPRPKTLLEEDVFDELLKERQLRDKPCLIFLVVFLGFMAAIGIYALALGDMRKVGELDFVCTVVGQVVDLPPIPELHPLVAQQDAWMPIYASSNSESSYGGRLPRSVMDHSDHDAYGWRELIVSLQIGAPYLAAVCFIALGFSICMLVMLRYFAKYVVWSIICGVAGIFLFIAVAFWTAFSYTNENWFMAMGFVATIVAAAVSSIIYALRKRIKLVIRLLKEGGKALQAVPLLTLQPLLTLAVLFLGLSIGISLAVLLETVNESDSSCELAPFAKVGQFANIFAILWFPLFLFGCQHVIVAGVVSTWFFTRNKSNLGRPLSKSYRNLFLYSIGSVTLGSLVIVTVKIVRWVARIMKGKKRNVLRVRPCENFLLWLDRVLGALSNLAYITIAMYGDNFFTAAKKSLGSIVKNAVNLVIINSVGDFVLYLAKILVVFLSLLCAVAIFQDDTMLKEEQKVMVIIVGGIFSYIIAHTFVVMFESAMDTIFVCFCEDRDKNNGEDRPYFMGTKLMMLLQSGDVDDVGNVITRIQGSVAQNLRTIILPPPHTQ